MICDFCNGDNATVFLTQIVDGKMQKLNLCEACAKEKGVTDPAGFALADLLVGFGAPQAPNKQKGQVCENCGMTQEQFKKTGRLGCSECYSIFGKGLEDILKAMHKGTRHVGKVPKRLFVAKELEERLRKLKSNLQKAVKEENYELAASIRDELRVMESKSNPEK